MPDALVSNNYGMTEAGSAYCIMPKGEAVKRPGSVGQIAPPAVVQIVDEHDQPLPPDVVGEVRLQMPGRQREYFDDPEATAETWRDGWLDHRRPRQARCGRLPLHRRPLQGRDHPRRQQRARHRRRARPRAARGREGGRRRRRAAPRARRGRRRLRRAAPGRRADAEELRAFGLEHLADYKVPRQFVFVDDLPRNPTGKVVKPELKARLAGDAGLTAGRRRRGRPGERSAQKPAAPPPPTSAPPSARRSAPASGGRSAR